MTQIATNLAGRAGAVRPGRAPLPRASGPGRCDGWELTLPAATRALSDPSGCSRSAGRRSRGPTYDFRVARPMRDTVLNHAFTDLDARLRTDARRSAPRPGVRSRGRRCGSTRRTAG